MLTSLGEPTNIIYRAYIMCPLPVLVLSQLIPFATKKLIKTACRLTTNQSNLVYVNLLNDTDENNIALSDISHVLTGSFQQCSYSQNNSPPIIPQKWTAQKRITRFTPTLILPKFR